MYLEVLFFQDEGDLEHIFYLGQIKRVLKKKKQAANW